MVKRRVENFGRYGNYLQNWKCVGKCMDIHAMYEYAL